MSDAVSASLVARRRLWRWSADFNRWFLSYRDNRSYNCDRPFGDLASLARVAAFDPRDAGEVVEKGKQLIAAGRGIGNAPIAMAMLQDRPHLGDAEAAQQGAVSRPLFLFADEGNGRVAWRRCD
jgi:hypothetical protein